MNDISRREILKLGSAAGVAPLLNPHLVGAGAAKKNTFRLTVKEKLHKVKIGTVYYDQKNTPTDLQANYREDGEEIEFEVPFGKPAKVRYAKTNKLGQSFEEVRVDIKQGKSPHHASAETLLVEVHAEYVGEVDANVPNQMPCCVELCGVVACVDPNDFVCIECDGLLICCFGTP